MRKCRFNYFLYHSLRDKNKTTEQLYLAYFIVQKSEKDVEKEIKKLDKQIKKLAEELNFEEAIKLRDKMNELKKLLIEL